jgi:chemotaxis signal transduction protein
VFSLRGEIVPALDLAPLMGMSTTTIGDESRIVVLKHELGVVGIVVDRLLEQRRINEMQPPPTNLSASVATLLLGMATVEGGTVRILDANAILDAEPLRVLRTAS